MESCSCVGSGVPPPIRQNARTLIQPIRRDYKGSEAASLEDLACAVASDAHTFRSVLPPGRYGSGAVNVAPPGKVKINTDE